MIFVIGNFEEFQKFSIFQAVLFLRNWCDHNNIASNNFEKTIRYSYVWGARTFVNIELTKN